MKFCTNVVLSNYLVLLDLVVSLMQCLFFQVQVTSQSECHVPFGVGLASDPMSLRRGAKKLPMEDVSFYQWPLPGTDQVITVELFIYFFSYIIFTCT